MCRAVAIWIALGLLWAAPLQADVLAGLSDPTRPPSGSGEAVTQGLALAPSVLVLQSTMLSESVRLAVINDEALSVGDRVLGFTLRDVRSLSVLLERSGRFVELGLAETLDPAEFSAEETDASQEHADVPSESPEP